MKKILVYSGIGISLVFLVLTSLYLLISQSVKSNIKMAQEKYGGTAEEALITFLKDESNSAGDRSHIAVWTLAQIESEKALPTLYKYYENDPHGNTCYGKHHTKLCQYEIYKAIKAIEKKSVLSHSRLKEFTSP